MNSVNPENNLAIIALTKKGSVIGYCLQQHFPGSQLFLPEKFGFDQEDGVNLFGLPAKKVMLAAFNHYRYLILVMAVGIAVRLIAPLIKNKHEDPAIIVIDETGKFAVSLLSGHSGANDLAKQVAHFLGAQPVVTTASEVSETIAIDELGKEFGWEIENKEGVTRVAAVLINGGGVGIYQDAGEKNWWPKEKSLTNNVRIFSSIEELRKSDCEAALLITDQIFSSEFQLPNIPTVVYRPKSLVVGIGCNRGIGANEIEKAVLDIFTRFKLAPKSISNLATIDIKSDELGLLEFARKYHLPIAYFDKDTLKRVDFPSSPSDMVLRYMGTPAVCESAAMLSSGSNSLIIPKVNYHSAISIAIARLSDVNGKQSRRGKLFLVGIGPGDQAHMTFRAKEVLKLSDVVVGYKNYVKLVEFLIADKEVISSGMREEVKRAESAIKLAQEGRHVAIICGGDSGIYGMTGLIGEILHQNDEALDIEVVPGIPALVASAALLGAPVTADFACISLSDCLVPWDEISHRLELAAQTDFVIIIYNPKSKYRQHQLAKAREIVLQHRSPTTLVGIVNSAYRSKQKVIITNLQCLLEHEVDMTTTIIIGNSGTFTFDRWMVTPRGYQRRYALGNEPGIKRD
ncbi:MAG: precorrin-3B C(17)-methyltransferase [Actinobacteria bacterium]|nr:precorrin-3B C(17)-methyltransferase [Actinomycetota bacterium]